ncbi:MAG: hypothetical protein AB7N76_30440 [Planctomycetota bacterium]
MAPAPSRRLPPSHAHGLRGVGLGPAETPPPRGLGRRLAAPVVAALVLVLVAAGVQRTDWYRHLRGAGYVPWYDLDWRAAQDADNSHRQLVVLRGPAGSWEHLAAVLDHPEVQQRAPGFVWLRLEQADQPATLTIEDTRERRPVLAPLSMAELTGPGLGAALQAALDADPGPRGASHTGLAGPF